MAKPKDLSASLFLIVVYFAAGSVHAYDSVNTDNQFLGGSASVGKELENASHIDHVSPWNISEFRKHLIDQYGLTLSADYATLYQNADDSLTGTDNGMGGVFRLYGRWTLIGRGTLDSGTLVAKVEHRHRLSGDVTPGRLAPELGYLGITGLGFTDVGEFLAPFYWEQFFSEGHVGVVAGRLDPTDFMDILGLGSQWNSFQNAAVLSNLSIPAPDLGFGFGAGVKFNDNWVIGTTLHDSNGKQTEVTWFKEGSELFKQAYVSWTPTRAKRFTNALHLTLWHQDAREAQGLEESYGVAMSGNWLTDTDWMPFFRLGIAHGNTPLAKKQFTMGVMHNITNRSEQLGIGIWWQDLSHRDLNDQGGMEVFYRWEPIPNLALTPSIQILNEPALNPDVDRIILFGLRARIVFF